MDKLGQDIAVKLLAENTLTISLFSGAFKPPTRSHFKIVENAAKISDQVQVIISNQLREGYSPELSLKIWKQYAKLLHENVSFQIATNPSPITEIYSIVKEKSNNYIVLYGKNDKDRFNSINENREKYSNVEVVDVGQLGDVSATKLREAISKRNKLAIKSLIPEGINVNDFLLNFQLHEIKINKPGINFPLYLTRKELNDLAPQLDKLGYKWLGGDTKITYNPLPTDDLKYYILKSGSQPYRLFWREKLDEIKVNNPTNPFPKDKVWVYYLKDEDHYERIKPILEKNGWINKSPFRFHYYYNGLNPTVLFSTKFPNYNLSETEWHNVVGNDDVLNKSDIPKSRLQEITDKIPGGLAKGKTLQDIADKHKLPLSQLEKSLQQGIKVEMEHTTSETIAKEIAMDHLWEEADYYDKIATLKLEGKDYHALLVAMAKRKDPDRLTSLGKEYLPEDYIEKGIESIKNDLGEIKVNKPGELKSLEEENREFEKIILKFEEEYPDISEHQIWIKAYKIFKQRYGHGIGTKDYSTLNESIQINPKLYVQLLNTLVEDCCKELEISKPKIKLINNDKYTIEHSSYGGYFPGQDLIKLVIYSRNCKDSLLTLCHEIRHHWQYVNGLLKPDSGGDGSDEENDCNSFAGQYLRKFGRKYPEIYFLKYS